MNKKILKKYDARSILITSFVAIVLLIAAAIVPSVSAAVNEEENQGCAMCADPINSDESVPQQPEDPNENSCSQFFYSAVGTVVEDFIDYLYDIEDPVQFITDLINNVVTIVINIGTIIYEAFNTVANTLGLTPEELAELMVIVAQNLFITTLNIIGQIIDYIEDEWGSIGAFLIWFAPLGITLADIFLTVIGGFIVFAFEEILKPIVCAFLENCGIQPAGYVPGGEESLTTSSSTSTQDTSSLTAGFSEPQADAHNDIGANSMLSGSPPLEQGSVSL